jgi:hypothetical protein
MFPKKNSRRGISTVLTTMIILVASVVLGTGVVIYGTSLFQTGAQQEAIATAGVSVWVNATDTNGWTWGAAGVRNSGDKIVSVDSIQVRGTTVPFGNWWVDSSQTRVTSGNFQSQFNYTKTNSTGYMKDSADTGSQISGTLCNTVTGYWDNNVLEIDMDRGATTLPVLCMTRATGPVTLNPGERMVIYFQVPTGVVTSVDAGSVTGVSIFAGKAGGPVSITIGSKV